MTLWDQCKSSFDVASVGGNFTKRTIFCEASALTLPVHEAREAGTFLNSPLVSFLEKKRDEGYQVHVYALTPSAACGNIKRLELDCADLPFKIESHTDLVWQYKGLRRGLVIAHQVSKGKDNAPLVHWDPHNAAVMNFLNEQYGDAAPVSGHGAQCS